MLSMHSVCQKNMFWVKLETFEFYLHLYRCKRAQNTHSYELLVAKCTTGRKPMPLQAQSFNRNYTDIRNGEVLANRCREKFSQ